MEKIFPLKVISSLRILICNFFSGRIENKTDRRVDKVAAILQQIIIVTGGGLNGEVIFQNKN